MATRNITGKELVAHWNFVAEKGLMNKNSANALRTACSHILGVLDDWETTDINELDLEVVIKRFQNLKRRDFKPQTLDAYGKRFQQAVELFRDFNRDPSSWSHKSRANTSSETRRNKTPQKTVEVKNETKNDIGRPSGLIDYPFPLRPDTIVALQLPTDLTEDEVKRLQAFIQALVV